MKENKIIHVINMLRTISKASQIKTKRSKQDFLADRIVQAATENSLAAFAERLMKLLDVENIKISDDAVRRFVEVSASVEAGSILAWIREYPRIVSMIACIYNDVEYMDTIDAIEIPLEIEQKGTAYPMSEFGIKIKITCNAPLSHGADVKAGNATMFRRMQVLSTTGNVLSLPFYAGNALRGQMRDMLANHFLKTLKLKPSRTNPPVNLWLFHALYAGGALEENSAQAKALAKKMGNDGVVRPEGLHELRDMIPPISVMGSALGNRILSGRVRFGDFRPRCIEWANGTVAAGDLFEWTYLTRREDLETHADGENSSMIVNVETLKSGTVLDGGIDISEHATDMERACIGRGLRLLQRTGYLGAENRRGFGKVDFEITSIPEYKTYDEYLKDNRDKIMQYLIEIGAINASD
jgi:hypothetical protein